MVKKKVFFLGEGFSEGEMRPAFKTGQPNIRASPDLCAGKELITNRVRTWKGRQNSWLKSKLFIQISKSKYTPSLSFSRPTRPKLPSSFSSVFHLSPMLIGLMSAKPRFFSSYGAADWLAVYRLQTTILQGGNWAYKNSIWSPRCLIYFQGDLKSNFNIPLPGITALGINNHQARNRGCLNLREFNRLCMHLDSGNIFFWRQPWMWRQFNVKCARFSSKAVLC